MEPGIPGLVGLRPTYIVAQLTRWRVGDRHAAEPDCMKRIVSRMSEADIAAVAAWLARRSPPRNLHPNRPTSCACRWRAAAKVSRGTRHPFR